jgi:hypothetical protein
MLREDQYLTMRPSHQFSGTVQVRQNLIRSWRHPRGVRLPEPDESHPFDGSLLHHVEGFQDDNLRAALQYGAPLGLRDGLVKGVSFDDRVATGHTQH